MMKLHKSVFIGAAIAAAVLNFSRIGSVSAGTIIPVPAPVASGPGLGFVAVPAIITLTPGNDNVPAPMVPDNNIVVPLKRFDFNGYIDLVFTVMPSASVTEYSVTEFVDNNTGLAWIGYNMYLGFGTGAGFVLSAPGDGLDFDFPTYDTPPVSGAFPVVGTPDPDTLLFSGGVHGSGAQTYTVRIDVPDLSPIGTLGTFTLRQIPVPIPEPSALVLAGLSVVGLALYRRHR
ncbi:MAG: PEP-CTERM sorting domain-containing protein [Planctomycetes bacterium]|nr:PEP-CTERM sorting domain-containing protein [Planctomycetota bacterium]